MLKMNFETKLELIKKEIDKFVTNGGKIIAKTAIPSGKLLNFACPIGAIYINDHELEDRENLSLYPSLIYNYTSFKYGLDDEFHKAFDYVVEGSKDNRKLIGITNQQSWNIGVEIAKYCMEKNYLVI